MKFRRIGIVLVSIIVLAGLGYAAFGYTIYNRLTAVPAQCTSPYMTHEIANTPADFVAEEYGDVVDATPYLMPDYQEVEFPARDDNVNIKAWFVPGESSEAIIIAHGFRACRRDGQVLLIAGMLHRNGYNILMIDQRNHGDSEIIDGRTTGGNTEFNDVLGAWDWLQTRDFSQDDIGLVGISLGGAGVINALGQEPNVAAIWIDSTFGDIREAIKSELARNSYPTFLSSSGVVIGRILGTDLTAHSPLDSIQNHQNRPIYITHGTADERLSVNFAHDLYAVSGDNATLWIVEGTEHVGAMFRDTDEYEARLNAFFDAALR